MFVEVCVGDDYRILSLAEPLRRCIKAGKQHAFVEVVVNSIPDLALERGVYSRSSIEKRFDNVFIKCGKSEGIGSKISSTISGFIKAPEAKFKEASEFQSSDGMSNEELLIQAKYFIQRNCLSEAVRCMVQLKDTQRILAQGWIEEARLVLEVRQAVDALRTYSTARGIGTLY